MCCTLYLEFQPHASLALHRKYTRPHKRGILGCVRVVISVSSGQKSFVMQKKHFWHHSYPLVHFAFLEIRQTQPKIPLLWVPAGLSSHNKAKNCAKS